MSSHPSSPASDFSYDGVLLLSFGGPEQPDHVMPFLENVVRGKNVPRDRLLEIARHYEIFGGVSPINAQIRALLVALVGELNAFGLQLPVYWGNRNWQPMLADTVREMADDGVRRALAFVTSGFGSYPGCRQYLEDIDVACRQIGPDAPRIDKLRLFYNHPGFVEAVADRVAAALEELPPVRRSAAPLVFSAHSVPVSMAERSPYERQLRESCRLVMERIQAGGAGTGGEGLGTRDQGRLVFQSASGPPSQPWLGPDIHDHLRQLRETGKVEDMVVVPLGFTVENMEVAYDLDVELAELCDQSGINLIRAAVVGSHPRFVQMIRELIVERIDPTTTRLVLGSDGPWPDACPADCCGPEESTLAG